ncbi:MAG: DUF488 domain-containing protein [Mycolicibacterium fortuitum]
MSEPIFTIGHSTRTFAEFADLLRDSGVQLIVDVRKLPGSTRYPQFDQDALSASLGAEGVRYQYAQGLTGRRAVSTEVPFEVNGWWKNRSFHNYADYAMSDGFRRALAELRELGRTSRIAVMCSEAVWWRCHRRIIADHLISHSETVRHIIGPGHVDTAQLSAGAVTGPAGTVTYPATGEV